jgi:hypothetical protein
VIGNNASTSKSMVSTEEKFELVRSGSWQGQMGRNEAFALYVHYHLRDSEGVEYTISDLDFEEKKGKGREKCREIRTEKSEDQTRAACRCAAPGDLKGFQVRPGLV